MKLTSDLHTAHLNTSALILENVRRVTLRAISRVQSSNSPASFRDRGGQGLKVSSSCLKSHQNPQKSTLRAKRGGYPDLPMMRPGPSQESHACSGCPWPRQPKQPRSKHQGHRTELSTAGSSWTHPRAWGMGSSLKPNPKIGPPGTTPPTAEKEHMFLLGKLSSRTCETCAVP